MRNIIKIYEFVCEYNLKVFQIIFRRKRKKIATLIVESVYFISNTILIIEILK
jgi:hypothetical protein